MLSQIRILVLCSIVKFMCCVGPGVVKNLESINQSIAVVSVFPSEIIQPLFDMANPNSDIYRAMEKEFKSTG